MDRKQSKFWEPEADYDELTWDTSDRNLYLPYLNGGKDPESLHETNDILSPHQDVFNNTADLPAFRPMTSLPPDNGRLPKSEEDEESAEDDSEGNPKTFMRVLTRFAERTSMQGVPYINMSRVWYAKVAWAVLFAVGFVAMCFHLYYLFKEYYAYQTHSVVTLGFSTLSFPAVTICNINPIKSSMMRLTSAELQAFVEEVQPSNIAFSMEEKRKKEPPPRKKEPRPRKGPEDSGEGSSSSSSGSGSEENYGDPPPFEEEDPEPGGSSKTIPVDQSPTNDNNEQTPSGGAEENGNEQPPSPDENTNTNNGKEEQPLEEEEEGGEGGEGGEEEEGGGEGEEEEEEEEGGEGGEGGEEDDEEEAGFNNDEQSYPEENPNINNDGKEEIPEEDAGTNSDEQSSQTTATITSTATATAETVTFKAAGTTGKSAARTTTATTAAAAETETTEAAQRKATTATNSLPPVATTTGDKQTITTTNNQPAAQTEQTEAPNGSDAPQPGGGKPSPPPGSSSGGGDQPKVRRRRFVDGFTISETNNRYQKDDDDDVDGASQGSQLAGNKSTIRAIEDEFKFLFTSIGRDIRAAVGHQIEDMLIECSFRGIECDESYFRLTQTAEYGNCFTLEREDYISVLGGPGDGLSMYFFTQDEEYIHGITNSLGFKVHIHQPGSWPNPYEEGIAVSAGVETNIALKQVNIERLGPPHGICESGDAFYDKYRITYTQKTCQQFCVQTLVMTGCACFDNEKEEMYRRIDEYQQSNNTHAPCMSSKETSCLNKVYRDFQSGSISCDCPSPCEERIYTKFTSTKQWPTEQYATVLVEHLCNLLNETECAKYSTKSRSDLALSFLKLVLYFEDLNYENITEEPNYEMFQFVSDVGGTIGLWIGLSLISFFEVLQFFYEVVHYLVYVKPKQKAKLAKKKKMRQKQQSVRHAIRFSNNLLLGKNRLHTVSGKLKQAKLEDLDSSDLKHRRSRGESQQSSQSSLPNEKGGKSDMRAPPYESVVTDGRYHNNDVFGFGRLNDGSKNSRDTTRI